MKVNIVKPDKPTELQTLIAELPFDPASEAEFKGLMLVEELLTHMKGQGINRTQLAERMGVGSPRVGTGIVDAAIQGAAGGECAAYRGWMQLTFQRKGLNYAFNFLVTS